MCRGSLLPDPRYDKLRCIIMTVMDDDEVATDLDFTVRILLWDEKHRSVRDGLSDTQVRGTAPGFSERLVPKTEERKEGVGSSHVTDSA